MTKAMKVWGTGLVFNGYSLGEVEDVGRASQNRNLIKIFTCDSANESAEYISSGIERGQITFQMVYYGDAEGTADKLQDDFDAGTKADLVATYKDNSTRTIDALITSLDLPGGAAEGGHLQYSVTFQLSGTLAKTAAS